jgi:hypothetical protein
LVNPPSKRDGVGSSSALRASTVVMSMSRHRDVVQRLLAA